SGSPALAGFPVAYGFSALLRIPANKSPCISWRSDRSRFWIGARRLRTAGAYDGFGHSLRGVAESEIREELFECESARYPRGHSARAAGKSLPRPAALQQREHRGRGGEAPG